MLSPSPLWSRNPGTHIQPKASSQHATPAGTLSPVRWMTKKRYEPSKDMVKSMRQLCETSEGNNERRSLLNKRKLSLWLPVIFLTTLVLVVAAYALIQKILSKRLAQAILCNNDICAAHGNALKAALSNVVQPCDNFYEYVCGGWQPKQKAASSVQEDMLWNAVLQYTQELRTEISLPARLYNVCMRTTAASNDDRDKFLQFMKMMQMSWPEEPRGGLSPFDLLVNLSVNWNMGLWFDVHVIRRSGSLPMVHVDQGSIGLPWVQRQSDIVKQRLYETYVKQYVAVLGRTDMLETSLNITQLEEDEATVLLILASEAEEDRREVTFPIAGISSVTESVSVEHWLSTLNALYHPIFNFTASDIACVQNVARLKAVDMILTSIPTGRLMNVIGWTFVQKYALLALLGFPQAGILMYGSAEEYESRKFLFCFENIQKSYGLLSVIGFLNTNFGKEQRQKVDQLIQSVKNSSEQLISNSSWIDNATKSTAARKLLGIVTDLWPGGDILGSSDALAGYYKEFPSVNSSFFDSYLATAKTVRALLGHERIQEIYSKFTFTRNSMIRYSHVMNKVFVALHAVEFPFHHHHGTPAMNYGGFGQYYATEIVKSFDKQGASLTENGEEETWWGNDSLAAYNSRLNCALNNRSDGSPIFPLLPALAISFRAFEHEAKQGQKRSQRLATLPQFTGEQIFFMSYCYTLCSRSRSEQHRCNFPLMNSKAFSQAFGCSPNSSMNPLEKCDFFT
ncbi:neprilysin-1-like [Ornithodoros turicata]|uniref:neprilysin-1-like n=1 Tax=Ornithodoros turicata TaxID=34597 RepID=UPI003138C3D8